MLICARFEKIQWPPIKFLCRIVSSLNWKNQGPTLCPKVLLQGSDILIQISKYYYIQDTPSRLR